MQAVFTIYGVFKRKRCVYVGCTKDLATRSAANKVRFGKSAEVKTLATSEIPNLARTIERNYIRKYKAIGKAQFNLNGFKDSKEKMRCIKVPDECHERLKVMAALRRCSLQDLVNQLLEKITAPYKSIRFDKRKAKKHDGTKN